ncbi:MAG: RIP metalloprotease RseP [Gammaproteobacteria bacterium]|nr:RIP metalloprotease RseP [Gammaproteobacteria bacterium]
MSSVLISIAAFIVGLGLLITVHEFGHFWVARKMGVKVLRFSIGFGRPLLKWQRGETEYVIAALPLGGYVKMLDAREAEVDESEREREFTQKPLYARAAIVFAGPLFNFIFAFLAYWLLFNVGITGIKPVIGEVTEGSVAEQVGINPGGRIVAMDGDPVQTWEQVSARLLETAVDGGTVRLEIEPESGARTQTADLPVRQMMDVKPAILMQEIGMRPQLPAYDNTIGRVLESSPAASAGLEAGDRIIEINRQPIRDWMQMVEIVRSHPDQKLEFVIERGLQREYLSLAVTPKAVETDIGTIGQLGVSPQPLADGEWDKYTSEQHYNPVEAVGESVAKIASISVMSLKMFWRMLIGQASLENLSGPITIADYAGKTASIGLTEFINFLALISISLGIINLLPVPLLDGGHLLYYFIEFVKGSPVSEQTEIIGQRIGIALLLTLMSIAFINDIARLMT